MNETKKLPLYESFIEHLEEQGQLRYGQHIEWGIFCSYFRIEKPPAEGWEEGLGEYISFCDAMAHRGFKVTTRGLKGAGFRIMDRHEMAERVRDDIRAKANLVLRDSIMLSQVPRDGLDDKNIRELDHMETKASYIGAEMKRMLLRRRLEDLRKKQDQLTNGKQP